MMNKYHFKNWNLFSKIFSLAVLILVPVLLLYTLKFLPAVENKLVSEKERNVKNTVEVAYGIIDYYHLLYQRGELNLEDAQNQAKNMINDLRYEADEYFWINDYSLNMVMHATNPKLNNTSVADHKDPNGIYIFRECVKIAKNDGEGYLTYMWPKPGRVEPVPKISYVKAVEDWHWVIGSGIYVDDVEEEISAFRTDINTFLIVLGLFALAVGFYVARKVAKSIKQLELAADKVSKGEVDVHIDSDSTDEVGKLAKSFNIMVENIKKSLEEIKRKGEEAEEAAREAKLAEEKAHAQEQYLAKNTRIILTEMEKFSNGDLTVYVKPEKEDDDIGKLFKGFNAAVTKIKDMILNVTNAVYETANASNQISSSSEQMAAGAQEQSVQASEVAGAVEEMTKTITEMAHNAALANDASNKSNKEALTGSEIVTKSKAGFDRIILSAQKTAEIISSLTGKTNQIGEIIQVIDEIADQTNLLALNAAIEAARAGEEGRGFAVVADEVRKLAERTTKATKEIADTIKTVQSEANDANNSMVEAKTAVDEGRKLNDEVDKSLARILEGIKNVNLQINQVAAASEQQSSAAEQISKNIESISNVTNESAMGIQQIAKASEDLNRLTVNLQSLINQFKKDDESKSNITQPAKKQVKGKPEPEPTYGGNGFH